MSENVSQRKDEHLQIATDQYRKRTNSFDGVDVLHVGVPNLRVADVSIATSWQGIELSSPIYINAMTGGSQKTAETVLLRRNERRPVCRHLRRSRSGIRDCHRKRFNKTGKPR